MHIDKSKSVRLSETSDNLKQRSGGICITLPNHQKVFIPNIFAFQHNPLPSVINITHIDLNITAKISYKNPANI